MWWLYENEQNANAAIVILNDNLHVFNPDFDYLQNAIRLTADPVIGEVTYLYGFSEPPENLQTGVSYDLETEYSQDWFIPEEL